MIVLLDTSALAKLLVEEAESPSLRTYLTKGSKQGDRYSVSTLAVAELRRAVIRLGIDPLQCGPVVERFTVVRLTEGMIHQAGTFPHPHLRTLDAMHLATAVAIEAGAIVTYDERQGTAARHEGLDWHRPGATA